MNLAPGAGWRWLFPDLALAAAAIAMFGLLFLYDGQARLLGDSDAGWHIRSGEAILDGAGLPYTDTYSFTKAGQPWMAWEWASEIMMGAVHRAAGLRGIVLLFSLLIATGLWLSTRLTLQLEGDFLITCAQLTLVAVTSSVHWLARPHVLSWIWLLLTVMAVEKAPERFRPRDGVLSFLLATLWANTHASYILGFAVLGLYAAGGVLNHLLWGTGAKRAKWCLLAALCALPGTLATPYGLALNRHMIAFLFHSGLVAKIDEYRSFNFHDSGSALVMAALIWVIAGATCAVATRRCDRALLMLFLTAVALKAMRGYPTLALVALPLATASISAALRSYEGLRLAAARRLSAWMKYSANLLRIDRVMGGYALMPALAALAWFMLSIPSVAARTDFPAKRFPVGLAPQIAALPANARIFAEDQVGGYIIYRFAGARKVFLDGRADFYGPDYCDRYLKLLTASPGWKDVIRSYGLTHAVLRRNSVLIPALRDNGWSTLATDANFVLLERPRQE